MFSALLVKEWREKLSIAAFAVGLMVLFAVSFLVFGGDADLRELIPAGFMIIFFPFLAVILGAGAFESEFRDGAWVFLLSRPVRKEMIWLAKLMAPALILAAFWLMFLGLMAVVPGLGNAVEGLNLLDFLNSSIGFLPLILLSSIFLFAVAFAGSVLAERLFSLIFGSFFIGLALEGLLLFLAGLAGRRGWLWQSGRFLTLEVFVLALGLSVLAVLAGSLITFRRADFSQPAKKASSLAGFSALLLALSWGLAATWPSIKPGEPKRVSVSVGGPNGEAFLSTTRGLYKYDVFRDKLKKIARWRQGSLESISPGGQVLFVTSGVPAKGPSLWTVKTDGSGKRRLVGGERIDAAQHLRFVSSLVFPDGRRIVYLSQMASESTPGRKPVLESIGTDRSGPVTLPPLDPQMTGVGEDLGYSYIQSWHEPGKSLIITAKTKSGGWSLWTYDLATGRQARIFEAPEPGLLVRTLSSDFVLWLANRGASHVLELYDVAKKETTEVLRLVSTGSDYSLISDIVWTEKRDRFAFLARQSASVMVPAVYLVKERKLVLRDGTRFGRSRLNSPALKWLPGVMKVVVEEDRSLRILDQNLSVERTIRVPDSFGRFFEVWPCDGRVILVKDYSRDAVWRLDLDTEKWKRIW